MDAVRPTKPSSKPNVRIPNVHPSPPRQRGGTYDHGYNQWPDLPKHTVVVPVSANANVHAHADIAHLFTKV